MKALDIMEAAGGIDDEIIKEVTSAMQEKNTGKPLRANSTVVRKIGYSSSNYSMKRA